MKNQRFHPTRRGMLTGGAALLGGLSFGSGARASFGMVPWAMREEDEDEHVLLVVQLSGGNDGLNTVVPFTDDLYYEARPKLAVPADKCLRIDDERGFHPLLPGLHALYQEGQVAILQGIGYAKPNRSHFFSFDIWHAADERGRNSGYDGWMTRLSAKLQERSGSEDPNTAVHVGDRLPYSLYSPKHPAVCFHDPLAYRWDRNADEIGTLASSGMEADPNVERLRATFQQARASSDRVREVALRYEPKVEYPKGDLAFAARTAAALIQERAGSRILSIELTGFDTHARQKGTHEQLLRELDGAVSAFMADIKGSAGAKRTSVMVFSEFGRRVAENGSLGTDHGTAGPMFLIGDAIKGGLYNEQPTLSDLDEGDLIFNTDFRSVYATVIKDWFGVEPKDVLYKDYPTLPVYRA